MIINVRIIINIRDVDIRDMGVRDVHPVEVAAADSIPGNERLTESERAPAIAAEAATKANANSPSGPAKPRHQGGRIVGAHIDRTRCPSPEIVVVNPTPVV